MARQLTPREFMMGKAVVLSATRSPYNPTLWSLVLNCGHGKWVTQRSRPKLDKVVRCDRCRPLTTP